MPKAESLKEEGNKHFKKEDYSKAIKCYRVGLDMEPSNPTLNCNLSQAYLALGDFLEAEVHAVVTLAHQADSVKAFYRAAKAASAMMKRDRALMYLKTGLANCSKADELKSLWEEISQADGNSEPQEVKVTKENCKKKDEAQVDESTLQKIDATTSDSRDNKSKTRSRSTSNNSRNSNKGPKSVSSNGSTSKPSSVSTKSETSTKHEKDRFIETLMKLKDGLLPEEKDVLARKREAQIQLQRKLLDFMKEGSEALMSGLARQASEKYKVALDILAEGNLGDFDLLEIDFIILKYSLSISWIQTLNYNNIVQSVTYLTDLEVNHAAKLPAVYFGLGSAFYRLNRFKTALQHLDKGIQIIDKNFKITSHPWPGTLKTISETTKDGLKESISKLVLECKTYRIPDAICRYNNCITESVHLSPSRIIFYSDPDFAGYVVIICQENCRITYHIGCWKHYKDSISPVGKLSDKEMLGHACLTSDCLGEGDLQSLIVCIEVYGEDGKIKTSCVREPSKTDNVNELRKEKKKRNEKADKILKVKPNRPRARRIIPPSAIKKGKSRSMTREFLACLQRLVDMRSLNFGFDERLLWNPTKNYFGRKDVADCETYLTNNSEESDGLKQTKDFIFTFFYEYLNDEGPKKFSVVERKWSEEVSQYPGIDFISKHDGICDFLLQSYRFASIDDNLCLADQISSVYSDVLIEMEQSASFILSCSSHSIEDDIGVNKCLNEDSDEDSESDIPVFSGTEECNFPSTSYAQCLRSNSNLLTSSRNPLDIQYNGINSDSQIPGYHNIAYASDSSDENYDEMEKSDSEVEENEEVELATVENSDEMKFDGIGTTSGEILEKEMPEVEEEQCSNSCEISIKRSISPPHLLSEPSLPTAADLLLQNLIPKTAKNPPGELKSTSLTSVATQTETSEDLEKTIEELLKENMRLKLQNQIAMDDKRNIMSDFQKKIDDYQVQIQDLEHKISRTTAEKEKALSNYQVETNKKDTKYDQMMKKSKEQMDQLIKKKEEDAVLLKKTLESMTELTKEDEKKSSIISRMEMQLRKANEQILNLRKVFGECKLDHYIIKCKEKLDFMNFMMKYMQHLSFSKIGEMKNAIDAWQTVFRELQDTRDLLQIQYDILAQQLKTKASADCLLQLELAELPVEPPYPLEDYNYIILLVKTYLQNNNVEEQNSLFTKNEVSLTNSLGKAIHPPLSRAFTETNNDASYLLTPGPSSFFSDSPPPPLMTHQFRHPNISETTNSNIARTWSNTLPEPSSFKDKSSLVVIGVNSSSTLPISMPDNQFRLFEPKLSDVNSAGSSEISSSIKLPSDVKKLGAVGSDFNKSPVPLEEKKTSSVSGLIPIEISKPVPSDTKESSYNSKFLHSDSKSITQSKRVWNYSRLLEELLVNFKRKSEAELSECLAIVREKNGNKLSGLTVPTIIKRVEKVLEEKCVKNSGSMGMDKFGAVAWGEVKEKNVNWINDELDNECIICHMSMETNSVTSLQCKHSFHTECVRTWLHTSSTCPICRKYTCLADEFPPLS